MQPKNGSYTFLLTHSNHSNIYIRRVEISKKFVNSTVSALLALTIGASSFAVVRSMVNSSSPQTVQNIESTNVLQEQVTMTAPKEIKSFNYSRPLTQQENNSAINNVGGPLDYSFRLTNLEAGEEVVIENQIREIERVSPPENMPSIWAKTGKINNEFSFRRNPFGGRSYEFHSGIDIDGEKGDVVIAPANGIVLKSGWSGGYGNMLEIDHGNGLTTRYGHLSRIDVKAGETIVRGQEVALVGSTGRSTGPHLHFEVRLGDKSINPRRFLPREPQELKEMSDKR